MVQLVEIALILFHANSCLSQWAPEAEGMFVCAMHTSTVSHTRMIDRRMYINGHAVISFVAVNADDAFLTDLC